MVDKDKQNMVKARLLVLSRMFYEKTDEDHKMDTFEIIDFLAEKGVPANTKTLRSDIALLKEQGMDIITVPGRPNKYFCGSRLFDIPELKLLIDAVNSSRFITDKKSRMLNRKLLSTVSEYQKKQLKRSVYTTEKIKPKNEKIFYTVDAINDAIQAKRKISFCITEYDGNKEKTLRNDGEVYLVSPYAMYWNDDFYYVVGWCDKRDKIQAFRVDRMHEPTVLEDKAVKKPKDFNVTDYAHKVFEMFDGDDVRVKLECRNELMKYVVDRFGEEVETEPAGDETFICYADVRLSPTFYGWVFGFGGAMRILEPSEALEEMVRMSGKMLRAELTVEDTYDRRREIFEDLINDDFDEADLEYVEALDLSLPAEYIVFEGDTFIGKQAYADVGTEIDGQDITVIKSGKIVVVDVTLYPFDEEDPEEYHYTFEGSEEGFDIKNNASLIGSLKPLNETGWQYELNDWKSFLDTDVLIRTISVKTKGDVIIVSRPEIDFPPITIEPISNAAKTMIIDGETMVKEKYAIKADQHYVDQFFGLIVALPYIDFMRIEG